MGTNSKEYGREHYKNNKAAAAESSKRYYIKNRQKLIDKQKVYNMKKDYNLTIAAYEELVEQQNFRCALCERHVSELHKPLFVDHDHTTGKVRGLLCIRCNTSLGGLGDSVAGLLKALNYLLKDTEI